ncbi:serine hydrolase domain-containing protein [Erythrobacter sanguineus]|uniref:CubicO group peptidase, beta-lactamase class C family n=1 Tax=Erythrobacter sanguineus TaxID=198312 RepID=A0A1M7SQC1_9SPHN|nr:serine hydrolase [Erythrobacter sanguineus]SHN60757.1 CubicO group peptidase, beta-lactamase class C family [Erythrobacter sanguineus]
MIRNALAATALLLAAAPAFSQTQQEALDARYDRALAAGYKALFLCSAIANAEANGTTRTPESVAQWELAGIQAPLDELVRDLAYDVVRHDNGTVERVSVSWADGMFPRSAIHLDNDKGCALNPIGGPPEFYGRPANRPSSRERAVARVTAPPQELVETFEGAFEGSYGANARTTAVLVQRDGGIVGERYTNGFDPATPQRTWSVAKSIAATLIGAAVQRGEADVNASAGLGYTRGDPRRAITIDHLLRMASGRYSDTAGNRTDPIYWGGAGVRERAIHWPLINEPGSTYRYANNDTLAAVQAIMPSLQANPPAALFAKLGMTHTVAEADWRGQYILSSQAWTTARDLVKMGQLHLQDGVWNGTRILPEGWVDYVSTPSGPQPDGPFGYGAGFWLMNKSEGVPSDTFAAFGNRGQYVVIVPSRNVVIVRRGEDPVGARFDIAAFTRDVLAALEG